MHDERRPQRAAKCSTWLAQSVLRGVSCSPGTYSPSDVCAAPLGSRTERVGVAKLAGLAFRTARLDQGSGQASNSSVSEASREPCAVNTGRRSPPPLLTAAPALRSLSARCLPGASPAAMSTSLAVQFMEAVTQARDAAGAPQSFDATALSTLVDLAAEPGRFTATLPVTPAVQNRYHTLHGGCIGGWAAGRGGEGAGAAACRLPPHVMAASRACSPVGSPRQLCCSPPPPVASCQSHAALPPTLLSLLQPPSSTWWGRRLW